MLTFALFATILLSLLHYHNPFAINDRVIKASQQAIEQLRAYRSRGILQSIEENAQSFLNKYVGGIGHARRGLLFSICITLTVYIPLSIISSYAFFANPPSDVIIELFNTKNVELAQIKNALESIDFREILERTYGKNDAASFANAATIFMREFKENVNQEESVRMLMFWEANFILDIFENIKDNAKLRELINRLYYIQYILIPTIFIVIMTIASSLMSIFITSFVIWIQIIFNSKGQFRFLSFHVLFALDIIIAIMFCFFVVRISPFVCARLVEHIPTNLWISSELQHEALKTLESSYTKNFERFAAQFNIGADRKDAYKNFKNIEDTDFDAHTVDFLERSGLYTQGEAFIMKAFGMLAPRSSGSQMPAPDLPAFFYMLRDDVNIALNHGILSIGYPEATRNWLIVLSAAPIIIHFLFVCAAIFSVLLEVIIIPIAVTCLDFMQKNGMWLALGALVTLILKFKDVFL